MLNNIDYILKTGMKKMSFDKFLTEAAKKSSGVKVHVFDKKPKFEQVKRLPVGDFYVVTSDKDSFNWDDGTFYINMFPATKNEDFFENADGNFVIVEIDPEYETEIDDVPTGFNSETGHISHQSFLVYTGIDLKKSDFDVSVETYHAENADEDEVAAVEEFKVEAKKLNKDNILKLVKQVESEINAVVFDKTKEIQKYEK